jgi:exodeoxyribonuclease V beta subunit
MGTRLDSARGEATLSYREFDPGTAPLDGCNLIEASAGTGKTFTISRIYLRLLVERGLPVSSILVVTFTEAATQELKERIYETLHAALHALSTPGAKGNSDPFFEQLFSRVNPEVARQYLTLALRSFDSAAVHTIHGFCHRVLLEHAFESGAMFSTDLITDQSELLDETACDFWRRTFYGASPLFIAYANKEGVTGPAFFRQLFEVRKGVQTHRVLPVDPIDPDAAAVESQVAYCFADVKDLWHATHDAIVAALHAPSLKKNIYSPKIVRNMVNGMTGFIDREYGDPHYFEGLGKWTAAVLARGTKKDCAIPSHPFFEACERLYDCMNRLSETYRQKILFLKVRFLSLSMEALDKEKSRRNLVSFDDMLLRVHRALGDPSSGPFLKRVLGATYKAALIDEFQDTDPVQYEIFNAVFGRDVPLFLIGDPKQAIYRFRGADIFAYFKACQNATNRFTLSKNYRSDKNLLGAINALFSLPRSPFAFDEISYRKVNAGLTGSERALFIEGERQIPFKLWLHERPDAASVRALSRTESVADITRAVAAEIANLIDDGAYGRALIGNKPVLPGDIAVLVRTNNEAAQVQEVFLSCGIPSVIQISESVFSTYEAFELRILLASLAEPKRPDLLRGALATSFFGFNAAAIDRLATDEHAWNHWQSRAIDYHDRWQRDGIFPLLRTLMTEERLRTRLLARAGGERSLTNIIHLAELLQLASSRTHAGIAAIVKLLSTKWNDDAVASTPEEEMVRLESDADAVRIVTIHKSKGLEYPIVFCPFNWRPSESRPDKQNKRPILFHDPGHDRAATLALDQDAIERCRPLADEEALAENMRLLYVALTRARSCCYCVWSDAKGAESSGLAWLLFGANLDKPYIPSLKAVMMALSDKEIAERLRHAFRDEGDTLEISPLPIAEPLALEPKAPHTLELACRAFTGGILPPRRVLSYSSLAHPALFSIKESPDYDTLFTPQADLASAAEAPLADEKNIIDFPRGAKAGIFLHDIFEHLDFELAASPQTEKFVREKLSEHGFDAAWEESVTSAIRCTVNVVLDPRLDLRLAHLSPAHCLKEMEFYFPLKPFSNTRLFELAGESTETASPLRTGTLSALELTKAQGHLKGYIDLAFEWQERYYIIDWKSNFLGAQSANYTIDALMKSMRNEHYLLQYHLYTVALHQFLSLRRPGYSYAANFGGIYYVFLRGIDDDSNSTNGIFFDRPSEERVRELRELLLPEKQ